MEDENIFYLYVDETIIPNHGKNDAFERKDGINCFAYGGILVKKEDISDIVEKYKKLCEKWNITYPLHSCEIRGRNGHFAWLLSKEKKNRFLKDLNDFLISINIICFGSVVDKDGYKEKVKNRSQWPIKKVSYFYLLERVVKYVDYLGGKLDISLEKINNKIESNIKYYTRKISDTGMFFNKENVFLKTDIIVSLDFKPKENLFEQIADLCVYVIAKHGYVDKYIAWDSLYKNKKIIDSILLDKEVGDKGIKYYCIKKKTQDKNPGATR